MTYYKRLRAQFANCNDVTVRAEDVPLLLDALNAACAGCRKGPKYKRATAELAEHVTREALSVAPSDDGE